MLLSQKGRGMNPTSENLDKKYNLQCGGKITLIRDAIFQMGHKVGASLAFEIDRLAVF